jgi:hypothetical protein
VSSKKYEGTRWHLPLIENVDYAIALFNESGHESDKATLDLIAESGRVDENKMVGAGWLQMRLRKLEERNRLRSLKVAETQANCLKYAHRMSAEGLGSKTLTGGNRRGQKKEG